MVSETQLASIATRRRGDLFQPDVKARSAELSEKIAGKSFLIIGGAGSIGSNTLQALAQFRPGKLHVVDQSENNLAELVRDLRNTGLDSSIQLRALPIDFGSVIMRRFLRDEKSRYDYVLNFAALKHVRSEKDSHSLLQMIDTNLVKQKRLLQWLVDDGVSQNYFCVSTDKAANPVNLMGASKRLMELLAFGLRPTPGLCVTSARFANVAFSDGSLLHSFRRRLDKLQPLAVPTGTQRYFVSLRESGQICLLASILAPDQHIFIPRLDPASDLHFLENIAAEFLKLHNLKPKTYTDTSFREANVKSGETDSRRAWEAKQAASASAAADMQRGEYPLLLTPLDTSGEKPYEEFVGEGERAIEVGLQSLLAIPFKSSPESLQHLRTFMAQLEAALENPDAPFDKTSAVQTISKIIPEFRHIETGRTLDDRR